MRLSHRMELMVCMCLSLVLSSLLAVHCMGVQRRRGREARRGPRSPRRMSSGSSTSMLASPPTDFSREVTPLLAAATVSSPPLSPLSLAPQPAPAYGAPLLGTSRAGASSSGATAPCRRSHLGTSAITVSAPPSDGASGDSRDPSRSPCSPRSPISPGSPLSSPTGAPPQVWAVKLGSDGPQRPGSPVLASSTTRPPSLTLGNFALPAAAGRGKGSERSTRDGGRSTSRRPSVDDEGSERQGRAHRRQGVPSSRSLPLLSSLLTGQGWVGARSRSCSPSDTYGEESSDDE
jgi:hypothetical protein